MENRLYHGDNLEVLSKLREELSGQIDLVYIDPPFSTGNKFYVAEDGSSAFSTDPEDVEAYDDNYGGMREYIEFLRPRIEAIYELLSQRGTLYLHIDVKRSPAVRILLDGIFTPDKFLNEIVRIKGKPKNLKNRRYGNQTDRILVYKKGSKPIWNDPRVNWTEEELEVRFPKTSARGQRYTTAPLHGPGAVKNGETGRPWRGAQLPKGRHWQYRVDQLEQLNNDGKIEWSSNNVPREIIYAEDARKRGKKRQDIWDFKDPQRGKYPTQKNMDMLEMIVETSSVPGSIVLDAFAGSGATLVAAHRMGRRFIGIDEKEKAVQVEEQWLTKEGAKFVRS